MAPLIATPLRCDPELEDIEVKSLLTPNVRRDLRQLFHDEDPVPEDGGCLDDQNRIPHGLSPLEFGRLQLDDTPDIFQIKRRKPVSKRSLFCVKRQRDDEENEPQTSKSQRRGNSLLRRTLSCGDQPQKRDEVKTAVDRLVEEEDLVGDGTETFCLPTIRGKHQDLKSISPRTMADVLKGQYDDVICSYRVIDCRYPYEYKGGHIKGAENFYTHDQIQQLLQEKPKASVDGKRNILIFHCEFSSERGPKMMRFLRSQDRAQNEANYPALSYPEVYLLDGGYKEFFQTDKTLCYPMEYKPMLHQGHTEDLRHFRSRSKSWSAGDKKTFSRLRF